MRRAIGGLGFLVVVLVSGGVSLGEVFRVDLPQLEKSHPYAQPSGTIVHVDLGSPLRSITSIKLEVSGEHTNGWWRGDGVEDWYSGPRAGALATYTHSGEIGGEAWTGWSGGYYAVGDGPFSITMTMLARHHSDSFNQAFLGSGAMDLELRSSGIVGWGQFVTGPVFNVTHVALVVDAQAVPEAGGLALFMGAVGTVICVGRGRRRARAEKDCPCAPERRQAGCRE